MAAQATPRRSHSATQPLQKIAWPADHHLFTSSLKLKDVANRNRTMGGSRPPSVGSPMFEPAHPEYPPCTYDPPDFLRARPIKIKDRPKDPPQGSSIGPGTYSPVTEEKPRVKVFRQNEPARDLWPHLKRDAQLPDPGKYWAYKPFFTPPNFVRTTAPPRSYIFG
jgi:hypothetical protein